jgi:hypothetical protein
VGDPDNPELVIPADKGIFRDQLSIPYNHHLKGVDPLVLQDRFNDRRGGTDNPGAPVWQDQFHEMSSTLRGGFLMLRVIRPEAGEERGSILRLAVMRVIRPEAGEGRDAFFDLLRSGQQTFLPNKKE